MNKYFMTIGLFSLLSLVGLLLPISAKAESDYWKQRTSLFEVLPIDSCDIVFLGNSITDGGEFHELLDQSDVKNRGIQSDVINGVRKRLDQITRWHPRKIFLLIGINDVSHGLSADQLADRYEQLVKDIRTQSPDTKLYIQSLMPINNSFKRYKALIGKENVIQALNFRLKEIASRYDSEYIDLWPALEDKSSGRLIRDYTFDGLHLNGKGYKAWMELIKPYLD
ncbi:MAG: GDSL-type esterase/lipase family protein [Clostridium sp.]|nr:GDSL-type esterase/lipase family protein [Prevotella sp.]MCM1429251.1 GDSL-type esterase/lipase family protein [Clostridium sp.]MCM1475716.1 GDSL-type esterase/lipase family protein [Muribaculaceae bacterium]